MTPCHTAYLEHTEDSAGPNKSNNTQLRASTFYLNVHIKQNNSYIKAKRVLVYTRTYNVRSPPFYQKQKNSQQNVHVYIDVHVL